MKKISACASLASLALIVIACGSGTKAPSSPSLEPAAGVGSAESSAAAASAVVETPAAASASAAPASSQTARPVPAGTPAPVFEENTTAVTVGVLGAVFRASGAELRIPGSSFSGPKNVVFVVDKKAKGSSGKLGMVYLLDLQSADKEYVVGQESASAPESTNAGPFTIKLPLPAGTESANLAIETMTMDEKTKKLKSTWSVVPMTKKETSDSGNRAVFELNTCPDGRVHLTSSAPAAQ